MSNHGTPTNSQEIQLSNFDSIQDDDGNIPFPNRSSSQNSNNDEDN